jgi:hypothetical protein
MKVIAAAALALAASGSALAQQQPPSEAMQAVRAACAADYMKLCPDAKTRDDRRQCMMANSDKFSDSCKAAIADLRAKMSATPAAPGSSR